VRGEGHLTITKIRPQKGVRADAPSGRPVVQKNPVRKVRRSLGGKWEPRKWGE